MPTNPMQYLWPGVVAAQAIHAVARLRIPDLLAAGPELLRSDQYLAAHPEDAAVFNSAMTQGTAGITAPALVEAYDFSKFDLIVDIGGGEGALLRSILRAAPRLRAVLFDLPQVVARAPHLLDPFRNHCRPLRCGRDYLQSHDREGVVYDHGEYALKGDIAQRCRIVGGDFFESVPEGADACVLKGVIHDWRDEDAARILRNVRRAIRPGGTLLLIESIVGSAASPPGLMELLMLVIGGCERTESEFRSLLASTGFALTRIVPLEWHSLIECRPA